jgi:hypothetical protein
MENANNNLRSIMQEKEGRVCPNMLNDIEKRITRQADTLVGMGDLTNLFVGGLLETAAHMTGSSHDKPAEGPSDLGGGQRGATAHWRQKPS